MERWFVKKEGLVLGPYSVEDLRAYVARGKVTVLDLVSRDGETGWTSIRQVPRLCEEASEAAASPPLIDTAPAAPAPAWYVARGSQVVGPLDLGALRAALAQGQVRLDDQVREVGATEWRAVSRIAALADPLPSATPALPTSSVGGAAVDSTGDVPPASTVGASRSASLTLGAFASATTGVLGAMLRGGSSEAWAALERRLSKTGVTGWRRLVLNLTGVVTAFGLLLGVIALVVLFRGLTSAPTSSPPAPGSAPRPPTTAAPIPAARAVTAPAAQSETLESRAQGAMAAVVGYLNAEQRLLPREPYWCGAQEMPGRFHNLIEWRIRPDYVHQRRADAASLPEWFRFTVDVRASNALGGVLTEARSYYVKRFPDGTYRLLAQCEDDDGCDALLRMDGIVYPAGRDAPCAFPRDEASAPTREPSAGVSDGGNVSPDRTALPPDGAEALDFRRLAIERAQLNGTLQLCRVSFVDGPTPVDDVDRRLGWALDDATVKLKVFCAPPPNSGPLLLVAFTAANQAQALNVRAGRIMVVEVTALNYINKPILRFVELR